MSKRIAFRHCDSRFGFLWQSASQPAARWHADGEGPANYFADTPVGAWAEFLRHEGITGAADLAGVRRSLWAVEIPADGYAQPALSPAQMTGGLASYPACQAEARRLRAAGAAALQATSAAVIQGAARGWVTTGFGVADAGTPRDGVVYVLFGALEATGWVAVDGGSPPAALLPLVRALS